MNVIFLDIDGVLNSFEYLMTEDLNDLRPWPLNEIDPEAIKRLNRLIKETSSKIVISSSWRHRKEFKDLYEQFGIQSPLYGETPSLMGNRGKEIATYLKNHPEIDNYVILDDYDFPDYHLDCEPLKSHFIRTSYNIGLSDDDIDHAISVLKLPPHIT